jgi:hypothetical protein
MRNRKKTNPSKSKEKTKFAIDFFKGYRAGLKSKKAGNRSFGYWSGYQMGCVRLEEPLIVRSGKRRFKITKNSIDELSR